MKNQFEFLAVAVACAAVLGCDAGKSSQVRTDRTPSSEATTSQVLSPTSHAPSPQQSELAMRRSDPLASAPQTAPEVAAPAVPHAVLSGVVERRDSQQNLAILAIGEESPNLVKPGDRVSEHWTVATVGSARLVLVAHSGHRHTVMLGSNAVQAEVQAPVAPVAPPPAPPVMRMPDQHMIEMAVREFNLPEND